jgi:hypothetical protein
MMLALQGVLEAIQISDETKDIPPRLQELQRDLLAASKLFRNVPFLTSLAGNSGITAFSFNNILASPRSSRNPFVFNNSSRSPVFHFLLPFVFNNSSRSSFIFNIFLGQRPVSDPDQHIAHPRVPPDSDQFPHRRFLDQGHRNLTRRPRAPEVWPCHSRESGNLRAVRRFSRPRREPRSAPVLIFVD